MPIVIVCITVYCNSIAVYNKMTYNIYNNNNKM